MKKAMKVTKNQVHREFMKRSPLMRGRSKVGKKVKKEELKRRKLLEKIAEVGTREKFENPGLTRILVDAVRTRDRLCWEVIEREIASLAAINGRIRVGNIFRI